MARRDWRLVSMWEGDPVGVDQKRPLVGFALVAVLCAVLMFVSVGRGFGLSDFVHPGRPIAAPVEHTPAERPAGPARQDGPAAIPAAIPAELSAQPLAAVVAAASAEKASTEGSETSGAAASGGSGSSATDDSASGSQDADDESTDDQGTDPGSTDDDSTTTTDPDAERDAAKAQRQAEREAAKAQRAG